MQAESQLFGFLNIYKPIGLTSHDVVSVLRKVTKIKQIGHTGTLDPFAEGVLPVCIGKATRLIEYLTDDKEYLAFLQFGKSTDTFDKDGEIVSISGKKIEEEEILKILPEFSGEISQMPPMYSAIKVKGKKLYEYARNGQEVKVEPRKVFIERIELKKFDYEHQQAQILVRCSKGTYIRSIANDLGKKTGVGAFLYKLIRTHAGNFAVEKSVHLDNLKTFEDVHKNLINPLELLNYPKIIVNDNEYEKISHGNPIHNKNDISTGQVVILIYDDIINAVGIADDKKILIKKVF